MFLNCDPRPIGRIQKPTRPLSSLASGRFPNTGLSLPLNHPLYRWIFHDKQTIQLLGHPHRAWALSLFKMPSLTFAIFPASRGVSWRHRFFSGCEKSQNQALRIMGIHTTKPTEQRWVQKLETSLLQRSSDLSVCKDPARLHSFNHAWHILIVLGFVHLIWVIISYPCLGD